MRSIRWIPALMIAALGAAACGDDPQASCPGDPSCPTAPGPASMVNIAATSCAQLAVVSGQKPAATSVWINGQQIVPYDEATTWMASVMLSEGVNKLKVTTRSASNEESEAVEVTTTLDTIAPAAPTVDNVPATTLMTSSFTLMGSKEAGASVVINGEEKIAASEATTWSLQVTLMDGTNTLMISSKDGCQESPPLRVDISVNTTPVEFTVDRSMIMSPTCASKVTLRGTKGADVAVLVNNVEKVRANPDRTWMVEQDLAAGANHLVLKGKLGTAFSPEFAVDIQLNGDNPAPPTMSPTPPAVTSNMNLTLMGTKPADTSITVNDMERVARNAMTTWSVAQTLTPGLNGLVVDTVDACRRVSGRPVLVEVFYDPTAPTTMITSPMQGATLSGVVDVFISFRDNDVVTRVALTVDSGTPMMMNINPPRMAGTATISWDTTRVTDGMHTLRAQGFDRAGTGSTPHMITVNTANSAQLTTTEMPTFMGQMLTDQQMASTVPVVAALDNATDDVGVAWQDRHPGLETGGDDDVFLRMYGRGITPGMITPISTHANDGRSRNPAIAAGPGGVLNILWSDDGDIDGDRDVEDDIIFRQRLANGQLSPNFIVVSQETAATGSGDSKFPSAATDAMGVVHVVWEDDGDLDMDGVADADIYYSAGGPGGFSAPVLISNAAGDGSSNRPRVAVTPDNCPHIVWQDTGNLVGQDSDGRTDIYYRGSTPNAMGGCTFGPIVLISEEPGFQVAQAPAIAADPNDSRGLLFVTWQATGLVTAQASTGMNAMFGDAANMDSEVYVRNLFMGLTGTLLGVSDYAMDGGTGQPAIAITSDSNVQVVFWETGAILGHGTDPDVFLRTWNGNTFGAVGHVSDSAAGMNTGSSLAPSIAVRDEQKYIVWQDNSNLDMDNIADFDVMYVVR